MAEKSGYPLFSSLHRAISLYFKNIEKVGQYYKGFIDGEDNCRNFLDDFAAVTSNSFCVRTSIERKHDHGEAQAKVPLENSQAEQDKDQGNVTEEGTVGKTLQKRLNRTEGKVSIF